MFRAALTDFHGRPTWDERYEELVRFKERCGNCNVPKADGPLGRWVARQRELAKKRVLSHARRDKLDMLGFVWNTNDNAWEARYAQLRAWAADHGHACVPIASGDLGLWVAKQRQLKRKGKLAANRVAALDALRFTWDTGADEWNEKFSQLLAWRDAHDGDVRVPFNSPTAGGLGWWVATQRQNRRKGKMTPERQARLDSIGFVWNPTETPRAPRGFSRARAAHAHARAAAPHPPAIHTNNLSYAPPDPAPAPAPAHAPAHAHAPAPAPDAGSALSAPAAVRTLSVASDGGVGVGGRPLPPMRAPRRLSNKRRISNQGHAQTAFIEVGLARPPSTKRHHSFSSEQFPSSEPNSSSGIPGFARSMPPGAVEDSTVVRRCASFGFFSPALSSPGFSPAPSGASTPVSAGGRSATGASYSGASVSGSPHHAAPPPHLPPLVVPGEDGVPPYRTPASGPHSSSSSAPCSRSTVPNTPLLPPVSSLSSGPPSGALSDSAWRGTVSRHRRADQLHTRDDAPHFSDAHLPDEPPFPAARWTDSGPPEHVYEPPVNETGTSWSTARPRAPDSLPAAEALADLAHLALNHGKPHGHADRSHLRPDAQRADPQRDYSTTPYLPPLRHSRY